jgi:hypothetical protein
LLVVPLNESAKIALLPVIVGDDVEKVNRPSEVLNILLSLLQVEQVEAPLLLRGGKHFY